MLLTAAILLALSALPAWGEPWRERTAPGLRLEFTPADQVLVDRLWPLMNADHQEVKEWLRMFPKRTLRVVLAPTRELFAVLTPEGTPPDSLGVYVLGERTIVLRAPRTDPGGGWDLRQVARHELAHAVIDMGVSRPVPLWLHEGLAILISGELGYLDEAQLSVAAVVGNLIPLIDLFQRFPRPHKARGLAYAQAASFVRYLLRREGVGGLQTLLESLASDIAVPDAFFLAFGDDLYAMEKEWRNDLSRKFSYFTLITSSSLLGGVGIPLVLLAGVRRWWQRRKKFREWATEESESMARTSQEETGYPAPSPAPGNGSHGDRAPGNNGSGNSGGPTGSPPN